MATTTTVTLGALIDEALNILYRQGERPAQVTVGSDALASVTDTTFTVAAGDETSLGFPMVVEFGQELMLITAKSADATPIFTVSRGYAGTVATAGVPTGSVLLVEPQWARRRVRNNVLRAFNRTLNAFLPSVTTEQLSPASQSAAYLEIPAAAIDVLRLFYLNSVSGKPQELDGWDFYDDVADAVPSGKMISLQGGIPALNRVATNLYVTYQRRYLFSGGGDDPAEAETIDVPIGGEDLPPMYAAAYALSNREVTRGELDRAEEWPNEAAMRNGLNLRLVQQQWNEFYRALDEARRLQNVPRRIRLRTRRSM